MRWYFELVDDVIELQARLEDGERLGDARTEVVQGEEFYGIPWDELRKVGSGIVEVDKDGNAGVVKEEEGEEEEP